MTLKEHIRSAILVDLVKGGNKSMDAIFAGNLGKAVNVQATGKLDVESLANSIAVAVQKWAIENPIAVHSRAPQDW